MAGLRTDDHRPNRQPTQAGHVLVNLEGRPAGSVNPLRELGFQRIPLFLDHLTHDFLGRHVASVLTPLSEQAAQGTSKPRHRIDLERGTVRHQLQFHVRLIRRGIQHFLDRGVDLFLGGLPLNRLRDSLGAPPVPSPHLVGHFSKLGRVEPEQFPTLIRRGRLILDQGIDELLLRNRRLDSDFPSLRFLERLGAGEVLGPLPPFLKPPERIARLLSPPASCFCAPEDGRLLLQFGGGTAQRALFILTETGLTGPLCVICGLPRVSGRRLGESLGAGLRAPDDESASGDPLHLHAGLAWHPTLVPERSDLVRVLFGSVERGPVHERAEGLRHFPFTFLPITFRGLPSRFRNRATSFNLVVRPLRLPARAHLQKLRVVGAEELQRVIRRGSVKRLALLPLLLEMRNPL